MSIEKSFPLNIVYSEVPLDGLDAKSVGKAIIGFANTLETVEKFTDIKTETTVKGLKQGSLEIQFLVQLSDYAVLLEPIIKDLPSLIGAIKNIIDISKHLNGKTAKKIVQDSSGQAHIENNYGQVLIVNGGVANIAFKSNISDEILKFIQEPLSKNGQSVRFKSEDKVLLEYNRDQVSELKSIDTELDIIENNQEIILIIKKPVLQGRGKWTFTNGANNILAEISDEKFLSRVMSGKESFVAGDSLRVMLRSVQTKDRGRLKTIFEVTQVLAHFSDA